MNYCSTMTRIRMGYDYDQFMMVPAIVDLLYKYFNYERRIK